RALRLLDAFHRTHLPGAQPCRPQPGPGGVPHPGARQRLARDRDRSRPGRGHRRGAGGVAMSTGIRGATADDGRREGRRSREAGIARRRAPMLAACAVLLLAMPTASPVDAQEAAADADAQALDEQALRADMQRMIERRRRELLPEYERRVRSEGRVRADAWLREQAQA